MDNYFEYRTSEGVAIPDTNTLLEDTWQSYKDIFGEDLSDEEATPQGRLVELEALAKRFALGLSALTINQLNPDYAGGVFLDAIASLFNIERQSATYTKVTCSISGVEGTIIPNGTKVFDKKGNIFATNSSYKIGSKPIDVDFYCITPGKIEVPENSITVVPQIEGVETITQIQVDKEDVGAEAESDISLLSRLKVERFTGLSIFGNLSSALNKINNVLSYKVYNNGTDAPIETKQGSAISIGKHSVLIIVKDNTEEKTQKRTDINKEIAKAIINNVSAGCGYTKLNEGSVTDYVYYGGADGTESYNTVIFNRAIDKRIKAKVTVIVGKYSGEDLTESIRTFLVDWSNNKYKSLYPNVIGDDLSSFYLANAMQSALGCVVEDLKIGDENANIDELTNTTVDLESNEIASFSKENKDTDIKVVIK
jgi:hypothetical protein